MTTNETVEAIRKLVQPLYTAQDGTKRISVHQKTFAIAIDAACTEFAENELQANHENVVSKNQFRQQPPRGDDIK